MSCTSGKQVKQEVFVISSLEKSKSPHFIKQPEGYYKEFNFIIDSIGMMYYYYIKPGEWGFFYTDKLPVFGGLTPEKIVQVSQNSIIDFLKGNVLINYKHPIKISISSQKDTIISNGFSTLFYYLSDSTKDVDYWIRKTTIEENIVLNYKKKQIHYDPTCIKWDSTKTFFREAIIYVWDTI